MRGHGAPRTAPPPLGDYWLCYGAILLGGLILLLALGLGEPRLFHWYVVPVFLCLTVVALDTAALACGRAPAFSPVGLFGLLGVQLFFGAPLLHVYWDYWMNYTVGPSDWRPWLGGVAWLNLLGLIAFRIGRELAAGRPRPAIRRELDRARFFTLGAALLVVSALAQTWIYLSFGGIGRYIAAYELGKVTGQSPFEGMGRLMIVAEVFPYVAFMMFACWIKARGRPLSAPAVLGALAVLLVCCLYFGGLRGSRSNTVWTLFWAVMVTHCWLRPVSRTMLLAGSAAVIVFMYGYGLYKGRGGAEGLADLWHGRVTLAELEQQTEKPLDKVVLTDLGRGDVQALILERIATGAFEPAGGRTYLADLAMMVPESLWPDRPPSKQFEGSELRFGPGSYSAGRQSHFVHGLAGEAMINFGPLFVVVPYFLWGCVFVRMAGFIERLHPDDPRVLLAPFVVLLAAIIPFSDLNNLLWLLMKVMSLPALLIILTSRRVPAAATHP